MPLDPNDPRLERYARLFDADVAPVWTAKPQRLLLEKLPPAFDGANAPSTKPQVLDVGCHTGNLLLELLAHMKHGGRIIAIDSRPAMIDIARRKVTALGNLGNRGVFYRTESLARLPFTQDVYDLVVSNLGLHAHPEPALMIREFARVCKQDGEVRFTIPLRGTFEQLHDLYIEVLTQRDDRDAKLRFDHYAASYPTASQVDSWIEAAGLVGHCEILRYSILFRSAREFFYSPLIEFGPLQDWKDIAGDSQSVQETFAALRTAIETYFSDRAFEVSVLTYVFVGSKTGEQPQKRPSSQGGKAGDNSKVSDAAVLVRRNGSEPEAVDESAIISERPAPPVEDHDDIEELDDDAFSPEPTSPISVQDILDEEEM